jgi:hypothetical protein
MLVDLQRCEHPGLLGEEHLTELTRTDDSHDDVLNCCVLRCWTSDGEGMGICDILV